MNKYAYFNYLLGIVFLFGSNNLSANTKEFYITLENNIFIPTELKIPANQKVKLIINNKDNTAEEFDSFDLNREKVLFPHKKTTLFIGPLIPGRYEYFGEYHPNSARGIIVVEVKNVN